MCNGAATIITGFATGKGGAFGLDLKNETSVELNDSGKIESVVNGEEDVGLKLAEAAVKRTCEKYGIEYNGASVNTECNIPVAVGLKTSSVAANAIVLATAGAIAKEKGEVKDIRLSKTCSEQKLFIGGREIEPLELINIGIDAAFDAKVTATGALDDASASFLGGYTVTDNLKRELVYHGGMEELDVVIFVPDGKSYSGDIRKEQVKAFAKEVDLIWGQARAERVYSAITLNGMIHCVCFNYPMEPAVKALEAGALCAGLSGTGPSVVALTREDPKAIKDAWNDFEGSVLLAKTNNNQAKLL